MQSSDSGQGTVQLRGTRGGIRLSRGGHRRHTAEGVVRRLAIGRIVSEGHCGEHPLRDVGTEQRATGVSVECVDAACVVL